MSAQRIYQDLKVECRFMGSLASVQPFVKKLKEEQPARICRMECELGEEAQVDYRPQWYERLLEARPEIRSGSAGTFRCLRVSDRFYPSCGRIRWKK